MQQQIVIRGAREHNLKNLNVELPRNQLIVITGLSGSGKSSLAFDTIYAEGQRRYVESLSSYARQFLEMVHKPDVDSIEGLCARHRDSAKNHQQQPAINRRHGDGDLRLSAPAVRAGGRAAFPTTGLPIESQTVSQMVDDILHLPMGTKLLLIAPIISGRKGEYKKECRICAARAINACALTAKSMPMMTRCPPWPKPRRTVLRWWWIAWWWLMTWATDWPTASKTR
jgi:excinuclease ABC subunit A